MGGHMRVGSPTRGSMDEEMMEAAEEAGADAIGEAVAAEAIHEDALEKATEATILMEAAQELAAEAVVEEAVAEELADEAMTDASVAEELADEAERSNDERGRDVIVPAHILAACPAPS